MYRRRRLSKKKSRARYVDSPGRPEKRKEDSLRYASSPASDQVLFNKSALDDSRWSNHRGEDHLSEAHSSHIQRNGTRSDDGMRPSRDHLRQEYERQANIEPTRLVPLRPGRMTPPPTVPPPTQTPASPIIGTTNVTTPSDGSFGARSQGIHHQRSFNSTSDAGSQVLIAPGPTDPRLVQALAQQVAVLLQSPGTTSVQANVPESVITRPNGARALPMVVQNHSGMSGDLDEEMRYTVSADGHPPPTYRARQSPPVHPSLLNAQNLHYGDAKF
ncbi:hypothetical protein CVT24_001125 [Panaeolus cyanescens]|uniref:Uncharacterized protein n=1 Tax=Panaeolus cyanescens TaxID=181874 RepID=A0A409YZ44_9AGAR|nr:hypothetical protein CVT24_001125 [Panaeolus cyanescens]